MWTYYKPITVQYYIVDWVSWVPRLTLLDLPTNWTLHMLSEQNSLARWGLTVLERTPSSPQYKDSSFYTWPLRAAYHPLLRTSQPRWLSQVLQHKLTPPQRLHPCLLCFFLENKLSLRSLQKWFLYLSLQYSLNVTSSESTVTTTLFREALSCVKIIKRIKIICSTNESQRDNIKAERE